MGQGLAKLDLDLSRLYFPEAPCSDVMKDLTQEFQVHEWGGVGRGSWEVSQPQLPSAPVGWSPATLMLEGLGQCCSLPWIRLPLQGNGLCFFLELEVCEVFLVYSRQSFGWVSVPAHSFRGY